MRTFIQVIWKSLNFNKKSSRKDLYVSDSFTIELKKYSETYKLLGEYDKKSPEDPTVLAHPGRLRKFTIGLQRSSDAGRAHSAV